MNANEIKLGYINIRGLCDSNHAEYLDNDRNLMHLDILVIAETWLNHETSNYHVITKLDNWTILKRLDGTDGGKNSWTLC